MFDFIDELPLLPCGVTECPSCGTSLQQKTAIFRINVKKRPRHFESSFNYCTTCNNYYATGLFIRDIRKKLYEKGIKRHEMSIPYRYVNLISKKRYVNTPRIEQIVDKVDSLKLGGKYVRTTQIRNISHTDIIREMYLCPIELQICPYCQNYLLKQIKAVAVSDTQCVKIDVMVCNHCQRIFSKDAKMMKDLANACISEERFRIHDNYNVDGKHGNIKHIGRQQSEFCRITLCSGNTIRTYVIVCKNMEANPNEHILFFNNVTARELLAAIVLGRKTITIDNECFTIQRYEINRKNESVRIIMPDDFIEIVRKPNGGYFNPDANIEQALGLVLCEKSQRFEPICASYDKEAGVFFVDSKVYRIFCERYGFPFAKYVSRNGNGFMALSDESLLHQLGYNVNKKDGLSTRERHELLGCIVDLGFIKTYKIVDHISSLICRNGKNNPDAAEKWRDDIEFITSYRVNPERFFIVIEIVGRKVFRL